MKNNSKKVVWIKKGILLAASNVIVQVTQVFVLLLVNDIYGSELLGQWAATFSLCMIISVLIAHRSEIAVPLLSRDYTEKEFFKVSLKYSVIIAISLVIPLYIFVGPLLGFSNVESLLITIVSLVFAFTQKLYNVAVAREMQFPKASLRIVWGRAIQSSIMLASPIVLIFNAHVLTLIIVYTLSILSNYIYLSCHGRSNIPKQKNQHTESEKFENQPAFIIGLCKSETISSFLIACSSRMLFLVFPLITSYELAGKLFLIHRLGFLLVPLMNSTGGYLMRARLARSGVDKISKVDLAARAKKFDRLISLIVVFLLLYMSVLIVFFNSNFGVRIIGESPFSTAIYYFIVVWAAFSVIGTLLANIMLMHGNALPFQVMNIVAFVGRGLVLTIFWLLEASADVVLVGMCSFSIVIWLMYSLYSQHVIRITMFLNALRNIMLLLPLAFMVYVLTF